MKKIDTIIFDLGGVLIDWNPKYVFINVFKNNRKKMNWFLENVCTFDWNEAQDAGRTVKEANEDRIALFPEYKNEIELFYGRWEDMLGGEISGTVGILKKLVNKKNYKVVALTNWSAETFPIALERFEFLHWFEGIVVSGEEKTRKPFRDIYQITIDRFNITPENSIFIDDNIRNTEAANDLKINSIQFKSAKQLVSDLKSFGIQL